MSDVIIGAAAILLLWGIVTVFLKWEILGLSEQANGVILILGVVLGMAGVGVFTPLVDAALPGDASADEFETDLFEIELSASAVENVDYDSDTNLFRVTQEYDEGEESIEYESAALEIDAERLDFNDDETAIIRVSVDQAYVTDDDGDEYEMFEETSNDEVEVEITNNESERYEENRFQLEAGDLETVEIEAHFNDEAVAEMDQYDSVSTDIDVEVEEDGEFSSLQTYQLEQLLTEVVEA